MVADNVERYGFEHYFDCLMGLVTFVAQNVAVQVAPSQVGSIDECHAAGAVAEDEEVACEREFLLQCDESLVVGVFTHVDEALIDVETADSLHRVDGGGSLACACNAFVYTREWVSGVLWVAAVVCFVVNALQGSHVARR